MQRTTNLSVGDFQGRARFPGQGAEIVEAIRAAPADSEVYSDGIANMFMSNQAELPDTRVIEIRELARERSRAALDLPIDIYGVGAFKIAASWAEVAGHAQYLLDMRSRMSFLDSNALPEGFRGSAERK